MEITIRPAVPAEAYDINTLVAKSKSALYYNEARGFDDSWVSSLRSDLLSPEGIAACKDDISNASSHPRLRLYIVAADTAIRGVLHAELLPDIQEIHGLYVADGSRGHGIGPQLLTTYSEWADRKMPHTLKVSQMNYQAVAMATRRGFRFIIDSDVTDAYGITTTRMQKPREVI